MSPLRKRSYMESIAEIAFRTRYGEPKPRPTTYKGIEMRSRLEARFAQNLDALEEKWRYEPRVYGPRGKGYLPDFEMLTATCPTFIEVKPTLAEVHDAERKMEVIWKTHPDALLIVACAEGGSYFAARLGKPWVSWQEKWAA